MNGTAIRLGDDGREDRATCLLERDGLQAILDSVRDGILTVDPYLRITHFNRAAEGITGFSRAEALGRSCSDVFQQILFGQECLVCKAKLRNEFVQDVEREIIRKDRSRRLVLVSTNPLQDAAGETSGVVVVFHDLQQVREATTRLNGRYRFHDLIGKNPRMQELYRLIEQVADSTASVLIEGESGSGKKLVARAIHYRSPRANKPFVTVNCSALAESLLESELFGHVKGAFTGASYNKVGRFELAHGGTIFLDEIGDISPPIQLKLLRVLETHEFERVGESQPRCADVRVITATNKSLKQLVAEGRFRDDLYYRLKVVPITLPPLRKRRDDIPLLVDHFIERFQKKTGKGVVGVSAKAMAALLDYPWPGNIRELENAIEHAFVRCQGRWVALEDLPLELQVGLARSRGADPLFPAAGRDEAERVRILDALDIARGNKSQAALALCISRVSLWRKIRRYGITDQEVKRSLSL